jgi:hypothetical protein
VRTRENKHRAEELAAVLKCILDLAAEHAAVAARLDGVGGGEVARVKTKYADAAALLIQIAGRLERGEHHAPRG